MLRFNLHLHGSWDEEQDGKRFRGFFKALGEKWWQQSQGENEEQLVQEGRWKLKDTQKICLAQIHIQDSTERNYHQHHAEWFRFFGTQSCRRRNQPKTLHSIKNQAPPPQPPPPWRQQQQEQTQEQEEQATNNKHPPILQSVKRPTLPLHFQVFPEHNTLLQTLTIWPSALGSSDAIPPGLGHFMRKLVEIVWNSAILEVNSSRCSGFGINNEWHAKTW